MQLQKTTKKLVLTALLMGLIMIATMFIRIPIPFTQGYAHLGDAMIFLAVLVLGTKYGTAAAAIGSALGDILGGFPVWAPWTLVIKGLMALIMGLFITWISKKKLSKGAEIGFLVLSMVIAGLFMVGGYYFAEGIMYGNWVAPVAGIPWNIGQFAVGMVIATALAAALYKTPAGDMFEIKILKKTK